MVVSDSQNCRFHGRLTALELESLEALPGICIYKSIRGDFDEWLVSGSLFKADSMVPTTQVIEFKS